MNEEEMRMKEEHEKIDRMTFGPKALEDEIVRTKYLLEHVEDRFDEFMYRPVKSDLGHRLMRLYSKQQRYLNIGRE